MAAQDANPLVDWYDSRIGASSTSDEAYGYLLFAVGVVLGAVGIGLVLGSGVESTQRGTGSVLAAIALLLLVIGPVIRLPLARPARYLSYAGGFIGMLAVVWFIGAYPDNFGAQFDGREVEIIGLYGIGIALVGIGAIFTPLLVSQQEEKEAAERRAAEAESRRQRAESERSRAVSERSEAESERDAAAAEATEQAERADSERAARTALESELAEMRDSQSQFEFYTDRSEKYRWRLRHRNGNILADSAQGYASRQGAQNGLSAVKRDAMGAGVIDVDRTDAAVDAVDEGLTGEDAPEFVDEAESHATVEVYEDAGSEHRWRLRHDNGNIIADSGQGYASAAGRDSAVERVRGYAMSADYLELEPAAFEIYRDSAGDHRWRLLHRNGNILADGGQGYSSRQKARQGVDSVRGNADGDSAGFDIYEDEGGEHRWRLRHDNGNIIADSGQGYASRDEAESAVERVTGHAPAAHVLDVGGAAFEIYEDVAGEWRWRLRHRNGNILADSGQGYTDRGSAEDGIDSVKRNMPNADTESVAE